MLASETSGALPQLRLLSSLFAAREYHAKTSSLVTSTWNTAEMKALPCHNARTLSQIYWATNFQGLVLKMLNLLPKSEQFVLLLLYSYLFMLTRLLFYWWINYNEQTMIRYSAIMEGMCSLIPWEKTNVYLVFFLHRHPSLEKEWAAIVQIEAPKNNVNVNYLMLMQFGWENAVKWINIPLECIIWNFIFGLLQPRKNYRLVSGVLEMLNGW